MTIDRRQTYLGTEASFSLQLIDMFAYLAFKALNPDALMSPHQKTPWKFDSTLGLPCLKAAKGTFREGHGVYAATVEEAQKYAEDYQGAVYLVAPLPRKRSVVGEAGWRAEAAVCLPKRTRRKLPASCS